MDEIIKNLFPDALKDEFDDLHWMDSDGTMVYTTEYIDIYGEPDTIWPYRVIEGQPTYVIDFKQECILKKKRPTHFYCRLNHFKIILSHILGYSRPIPRPVLDLMPDWCETGTHWETIRTILKENNLQSYYNRIPAIIREKQLLYNFPIVTEHKLQDIINDFWRLNIAWNHYPSKRTYFPMIRFVVLRLLYENDIDYTWIPWTRTVKKFEALEEEFNDLWDFMENYEIEIQYYDKKKTPKTCKYQCQHCKHEMNVLL